MSSERPPIIAISGKSGCGNSTVSRLVASQLGLRILNYTFTDMATEMGLSFDQLYALAQQDDRYDRQLDARVQQRAMAGGCVVGNRLSIWLIESADLKIYLSAPVKVRAARVALRESLSQDRALRETTERDSRDRQRYLALYGIDIDDPVPAHLVIDAAASDQFGIKAQILARFRAAE